MAEPADVSIIVRDGSPEPVCTVQVALKIRVAEIVEDGKTGFIVDSEDEAGRAVEKLHKLDRRVVRRVSQERFTADVMARNYLRPIGGFAELLLPLT